MKLKPRDIAGALVGMGNDLVRIADALGAVVFDDDRVAETASETACAAGYTFLYVHPRASDAVVARAVVVHAMVRLGVVASVDSTVVELLAGLAAPRPCADTREQSEFIQRRCGPKRAHPFDRREVDREALAR